MPRLVSLTLLSALMLPAAAIVYFVVVVIGLETFNYRDDYLAFLLADVTAFATVMLGWVIVWWRAVAWTSRRITATILAAAGATIVGLIIGLVMAEVTNAEELGIFIGGCTTTILWMIAASIIWRTSPLELAQSRSESATPTLGVTDVKCPRCQYVLNGLREARCPECGEVYTLDALYAAQRPDAALDVG